MAKTRRGPDIPKGTPTVLIGTHVPEQLLDTLDDVAHQHRVTRSRLMRLALNRCIEDNARGLLAL